MRSECQICRGIFTGEPKKKWIATKISAVGNNKRKAQRELRRILTEWENKNVIYSKEIKFSDWLYIWLEIAKYRVEQNTYEGYESYIRVHLKPYFDKKKVTLSNITPQHIQKYYTEKLENGRYDGKGGLSPNSIKRHCVVINSALNHALNQNLIAFNPTKRTTLPKAIEKFKGNFYTEQQINDMLQIMKGSSIETAVIMAAYYGLRRSEICGLKWSAIDFDNKTMQINNTVVMTNSIIEKQRTKNKASNRTLPLFEDMEKYLKSLKRQQAENKLLFGQEYQNNDFVCKWNDGRPVLPTFVSKKFKQMLIENNMPVIRFHDLRHSAASLLLSKGFSLKQIQDWLGHCNISCTSDIYGHLEYKSKLDIADEMGSLIKMSNVMAK